MSLHLIADNYATREHAKVKSWIKWHNQRFRKARGIDRVVSTAFESREVWSRRIPTGALNRWLQEALEAHPPPIVKGRRLKLRYAAQIKRRPPTVAIFGSRPSAVPESYVRYLANGLRRDFDLPGVPIRILLRAAANPYAGDA